MHSLWHNRRVGIIGATGFIGSHLVERLVGEGAAVLAVARRLGHLAGLSSLANRYEFQPCDICDPHAIGKALRSFRPEIVFHLAAHPDGAESIPQMRDCLRVNMIGGMNALEAAIAAGSKVFVLADSCKVYGNGGGPYTESAPVNPICSYATTKAALWQLCQLASAVSGIQVVGLRLTFVYGLRQGWNLIRYVQKCVKEGIPVCLQGGAQTRDPLYIDDAVEAFLAAATRPAAFGHSIPIGAGNEISVTDLCRAVLMAMEQQVPIVEGTEEPRLTEIWRSVSDNRDALRLLNWAPRTRLAEGLAKTVGRQTAHMQLHGSQGQWVGARLAASEPVPDLQGVNLEDHHQSVPPGSK
jgi:nucleoside-diphosphate-sugar epimerase